MLKTREGKVNVRLSNTLGLPNLALSLSSILSLDDKNIFAYCSHFEKLLIDLDEHFSILGYATEDDHGLEYISDDQNEALSPSNEQPTNKMACMEFFGEIQTGGLIKNS